MSGHASDAALSCEKCGASDVRTIYHAAGCSDKKCRCASCTYGSHAKRHDEHLHRFCQGCHFDWTEDILNANA